MMLVSKPATIEFYFGNAVRSATLTVIVIQPALSINPPRETRDSRDKCDHQAWEVVRLLNLEGSHVYRTSKMFEHTTRNGSNVS
jgi:hypothetical protein